MPSHDVRILRSAVIPTALAGVAAALAATAFGGTKGLIGAAFAALLVLGFFSSGLLVLERLTRGNPQMMLSAGLMVYMTQILLVGVVLAVFKNTQLFDRPTFGLTLLGCAIVWTAAQVRAGLKAKIMYVVPEAEPEQGR